MDCKMSAQNAQTLDKICSVVKSKYLVFDTTESVKLQLISEQKNLVCNISINSVFFDICSLKNIVLRINKPRFFYQKMLSLEVVTKPSFLIFIYEFEDYIYRHRYVIFNASLYKLPFVINRSDYFDAFLLYQVISQVSGEAKILFDESFGRVYNETISLKFECKGFSGISFVFDTEILRRILSINDNFDSCLLNWEDSESPVNFNFYSTFLSVFIFVAT